VAIGGKAKSGAVLAVPARGPAEAQKIIDALGKKITTRGDATLVEGNTGGRGWLYRSGNIVVLSDEVEALARGTMLTLEARRAGSDDLLAVAFPEAIARANGLDVKSMIDLALQEIQRKQGAAGGSSSNDRSLEALREVMAMAGEASSIEMGLVSDPARGLIVRVNVNARPGTRLESVAKEVKPFKLDPAVATSAAAGRVVLGANSLGPFWRGLLATYRDRLAGDKQKGAAAALAYYDAVLAALAGQQSTSLSLLKEAPYASGAFSIPLKDAASAGKVASALAALDSASASALLRAQLGDETSSLEWTVKKESVGKLKTQHFRVKLKKEPRDATELTRRLFKQTLDVYWTVADTRMLVTLGKDARARLTAVASGKAPTETNKVVADAQAAAAARDLFYYIDVAPLLGVIGALSEEQRLAALGHGGGSPIPLIFTAGGDGAGKVWMMDMTIPVAAFTAIGSLIAAGMSGGN
jgi:hypothetical protein